MGCINGKERCLTQEDLDFITKHTSMKQEEIELKFEFFKQKHPTGKLSKAAFHELMTQCYPDIDVNNIEKHIFRMYDCNNDGEIDFREFMILLYIMSSAPAEENLRQIFRLIDINNDGAISLAELRRVVNDFFNLINERNVGAATQELVAETAFKEMDENMDGKVSLEEFQSACLSQKQFSTMLTRKIVEVFVDVEY